FGYYTTVTTDGETISVGEARDYGFEQADDGVLTFSFTLPVSSPAADLKNLIIEILDPSFFAYFTIPGDEEAVHLLDAPKGCTWPAIGPKPLDLTNTRTVPAVFWAALDGSAEAGHNFINRVTVTCP